MLLTSKLSFCPQLGQLTPVNLVVVAFSGLTPKNKINEIYLIGFSAKLINQFRSH